MATPSVQRTNDENAIISPPKKAATQRVNATDRRVLGECSPNVKKTVIPATNALRGKPLSGSPLKRSFTAAMEGGEGFTYLKKRKLSDDEYLSDINTSAETSHSQLGDSQFRPLLQPPRLEIDVPEIHEPSPTEPNTPTSDDDTQGSSAERKSFSSLINYDPSSQTSNIVYRTISDAEMLRLRLRVAMYKVRTNQVEVPFADLQVENREWRSTSQEAVEEAVAQLRKEAYEIQARDQARKQHTLPDVPKLLPAPVLKPTAYSSRMIYDSGYPSSPPASRSPERLSERRPVATPRHRRVISLDRSSAEKCDGACEQELTSSVVKGRVAEGLLGLRHAV